MNVDLNQIIGLVSTLVKSAPAILGWFVIARLAFDRLKAWRQPILPIEAAYTMVALAAFVYAIR
jgi:hypothetical protein